VCTTAKIWVKLICLIFKLLLNAFVLIVKYNNTGVKLSLLTKQISYLVTITLLAEENEL